MEDSIQARVFKIESKDYYLLDNDGNEIRCSLRGKFKKEFGFKADKLYKVDIVAVGDIVDFEFNKDGSGVINKVLPRKNYLSRKVPKLKGAGTRGERLEQIIAANVDNLIIITSRKLPEFNNRLLDRLIVTGESSHVSIKIVINKADLSTEKEIRDWIELYSKIGYDVFETSAKEKTGISNLRDSLKGQINLFWGHSGVGKSSLLNALYPELDLKIGEISKSTSKGKHTTVTSLLKKVSDDTFIIDTPGIREIDPYGIRKEDLSHFFLDFSPYMKDCRFNTCTHQHEPGCAIIEAVENKIIHHERYKSYLNILKTIEDDMNF
ncbi:MAG: ribosome small subunit-dependent GTPase A [Melioribacteraceae bacterium]|nr:ribosome small subunit-dependent GTPase A [Melioribacteraceae bacterium]